MTSSERQLRRAIDVSNGDLIPRPLSLRVCLPVSSPSYLARLEREIDLVARLFDRDREVVALEFDCTVPEPVEVRVVDDLLQALRAQYHIASKLADACRARSPGPCEGGAVCDHDLIGFGVGAVSNIGGLTFRNLQDLSAWQRAIDAGRLPVGSCGRIDVPSQRVAFRHPTTHPDRR